MTFVHQSKTKATLQWHSFLHPQELGTWKSLHIETYLFIASFFDTWEEVEWRAPCINPIRIHLKTSAYNPASTHQTAEVVGGKSSTDSEARNNTEKKKTKHTPPPKKKKKYPAGRQVKKGAYTRGLDQMAESHIEPHSAYADAGGREKIKIKK